MVNKYLKNKRITSWRAIARILAGWKKDFVALLNEKEAKGAFFLTKEDIVEGFIADIKYDLPDYYDKELPAVIKVGASKKVKKYKELLPTNYLLGFDLPTSPASNYVRDLVDLNLSTREGSTLKTTRDELRRIIADGLDAGKSYGQIAKEITETDPFVFSKTRGQLIAVNEIGRAYWFWDYEPARELSKDYVMEKHWDSTGDNKVRPEHKANEAEGWIAFDKNWSWTGDEYAPSQDINCRCTSTDRITAIKSPHGIIETKDMTLEEVIALAKKNHFCNHRNWV